MNGKTVLLVDDSPLVAGMAGEALREAGFDVIEAADGFEAVEACYRAIPDIVVMDIDMPTLKGYQASRLLKSRRGVRDIPIVMHTAASEDKDRFWSYDSGACAFVAKNFDNLGPLVDCVREHVGKADIDARSIAEDAKGLTRESISALLADLFDKELFRSTVMNRLSEAGRSISSLTGTAMRVLELLDLACERQVAVLLLRSGRDALPFVFPTDAVNKEMADDLLSVSLEDFFARFDRNALKVADPYYFGIDERADWTKIRLEGGNLSSYFHVPLFGSGNEAIGSLHLAHLRNNYFSPSIAENVGAFAAAAGTILHNAMLFKRISTMERDIRAVFSKFVPQEVIEDLVTRKATTSMLAGEKRELAILFCDIRSFTTLSESNSPELVVSFLNRYLEAMCEIIVERGGVADKFIGDGILAVFGAPRSWPDNAARAVDAAVAMSRAIGSFDTSGVRLPPCGLDVGIGLHLGDAIVGTVGSSTKFEYTVIGDTVNLASRLEGLSKQYKVRIIASERIVDALGKERRGEFREIERVIVKGKEEPTLIFALEGDRGSAPSDEARDAYKKALSMYKMRNWALAAEYFGAALASNPGDPLSAMFRDRCAEFDRNPPPDDWDFVQRYLTK
jgi:class 3 adenylate cyclase/DNA-binding response OmpR family regulator